MTSRTKKRYSILLSQEIAERLERVARRRNGAKSAIIEETLDRRLNPERYPLIDEALLRRLDGLSKDNADCKRDLALLTEMVALFVRYYLAITPPLAAREHQAARMRSKQRFDVFVAQIGRRVASDRRLIADASHADVFAAAADDAPLELATAPPAERAAGERPNGGAARTTEAGRG